MFARISTFFRLSRRELTALLVVFALTLPAVTPRLYSSDEIQYFSYLRSLWFDHDVSFENEYRYFYDRGVARTDGFYLTFLGERWTEAGRRINFGTLGSAILWSPFYAVADITTRLMRAAGSGVPVDGFSRPYVTAVALGSAIYGFLAVLLAIRAARLLTGAGILAGVLVWAGTPLIFYMYAAPPFSHACSAFAVALFVTVWLHVRRDWSARGMAALGASAALMAMVREQDVFFALGPAIDWAFAHKQSARGRSEAPEGSAAKPRRRARASGGGAPRALNNAVVAPLAGISVFVLTYLPQLIAYRALNGHFGPSRIVMRKMTWTAPHALGVVASPEHGFFIWTPLAVLAISGLVLMITAARRVNVGVASADVRRIGACMLLMVALQVYIGGSVESWTVAGAFGQRRFVALTLLLVVGLAALWQALPAGAPHAAAGVVAALAVWWNLALIAEFATGLMDRQRLEPKRNAYHAFVTLPRMAPQLAWRYLVQRDSFYRAPAPETR